MAKTEEAEETTELRSQMYKHELFVEWMEEEYGVDLEKEAAATVIAWFAAKRNEFRKSATYEAGVEEHKKEAEAERKRKAAERAEREKAAKAAEGDGKSKAKGKSTKAAKSTKKTAKRASRSKAKSEDESTDENPFD